MPDPLHLGEFDLVVFDLDHGGSAHDLQQNSHSLTRHAVDQAFHVAQRGVLQTNGLTGRELTDFLQRGVISVIFKLADALNQIVLKGGWLKAKPNKGRNTFGVAHSRNALRRCAGPKQDVARKHGLKKSNRSLLGFFELFVKRQVNIKGLLLKVQLRNLLLPRLGVSKVPAV